MKHLLINFWRDEQGGEVLEYALLVGLVVVAAIVTMSAMGIKIVEKWNELIEAL